MVLGSKYKSTIWKVIVFSLLFCFNHVYGQPKPEEYRYIKTGNKEGLYVENNANLYGKESCFTVLKKIEKEFEQINVGYPDYYRIYWGFQNKKEGIHLWVFLIPKLGKTQPYVLTLDKRTLSVRYYPNRKLRLTKVIHGMMWPYE
ncbi:hypothetical protein [Elizabethkingia meningoseptica]|uniref:hypothetical protein n=1 Tax=Elizabethkingia meningoseptica TaxID=238 RepID=UPI0038929835